MAGSRTLQDEMLGGVKIENQWSILLLDRLTTQIMSSIAGVSNLLDYGVSRKFHPLHPMALYHRLPNLQYLFTSCFVAVVDNVLTPREPQPDMTGIYFVTPTEASVRAIVSDFSRRGKAQYRKVHIFFSSAVDAEILEPIRRCAKLIECLVTLKEVNLEYILYPDNRSFTTGQEGALQAFFSASVDATDDYKAEVKTMADRLVTIFSTMKEFPSIRYRAALPPGDEYPPGLESRLLLAQRLAVEVYDRCLAMQKTDQIPERETCDLIIMDRGFDPVAPIIHEWTYEAMAHDLLEGSPALHGKMYTYESQKQGGGKETKEHALDDRDATFRTVRHRHFAAATVKITDNLNELRYKSRVAARPTSVGDMDLRNMAKLVQALPQYRDQLAELAVHIELASALNRIVEQHQLTDVGKLEQDLVYGDANSKDVISLFSANQVMAGRDKVRLLMCYAATHQEKFDAARQIQWQRIARLTSSEMATILNLEYLGVPVCKRSKGTLTSAMTFGRKRKRALRKDREPDEDAAQFALTRFIPLMQEVIEDAVTGRLSQDEYPYVRPPPPSPLGNAAYMNAATPLAGATSFRTVGKSTLRLRKGTPDRADQSIGKGSRVYAFVIGGFTFSELRSAHRLTGKLGRDIMVGGTSVVTPGKFMQQLVALGNAPEMAAMQEGSSVSSEQRGVGPGSPVRATGPPSNTSSPGAALGSYTSSRRR